MTKLTLIRNGKTVYFNKYPEFRKPRDMAKRWSELGKGYSATIKRGKQKLQFNG